MEATYKYFKNFSADISGWEIFFLFVALLILFGVADRMTSRLQEPTKSKV